MAALCMLSVRFEQFIPPIRHVLCLGARVIGKSLASDIVDTWLKASFDGLPSHRQRLDKVAEIERQYAPAPAASKASSK